MTAASADLLDWLRLAAIPGLGAERQRSLLAAFGLPRHIFAAGRSALAGVVGRELADAGRRQEAQRLLQQVEEELE